MALHIQSPVPRPESLRWKLSDLAWEKGISTFFLEEVPFSYSTGRTFSKRLVTYLLPKLKIWEKTESSIHIYEVGAGLGVLSKTMLDMIQKEHPEIYKKITWHVSEYSEKTVSFFKQLGVFDKHGPHIHIHHMNVMMPHLEEGQKPHVVLMSYLLDSLNPRHFELRDGEIWEYHIETSISAKAQIFDTTVFPPQLKNASDIQALLQSREDVRIQALLPQLAPLLKEKQVPVLAKKSAFTQAQWDMLEKAKQALPPQGIFPFNLSFDGTEALQKMGEQLRPDGEIVIQDFGFVESHVPIDRKRLATGYQAVSCCALHFPVLKQVLSLKKLDLIYTRHEQGKTQMAALQQKPFSEERKEEFLACFPDIGVAKVGKIVRRIWALGQKKVASPKQVAAWVRSLSEEDQDSYIFLMALASHYEKNGEWEQAIAYAEKTLISYDKVGVPSYLLMAKCYKQLGAFEEAEKILNVGLMAAPDFPALHNELSLLYARQGRFKDYINRAKQFFYTCGDLTFWSHVITMAVIHLQDGNRKEAQSIFDWIDDVMAVSKDSVPTEVQIKAHNIRTQFLDEEMPVISIKPLIEYVDKLDLLLVDMERVWAERGGPPGLRKNLEEKLDMVREGKISGLVFFLDGQQIGVLWVEKVSAHYGNAVAHAVAPEYEEKVAEELVHSGLIENVLVEFVQFTQTSIYKETFLNLGLKLSNRHRMALYLDEITPKEKEIPGLVFETMQESHLLHTAKMSYAAHQVSLDQRWSPDMSDLEKRIELEEHTFSGKSAKVVRSASLVAQLNGRLVGSILIVEIAYWGLEAVPWVFDIVVDPEHMGQGIGRALIQESMKRLAAETYTLVGLSVTEDNLDAIRLYKSIGFNVVDDFQEYFQIPHQPS